MLDVGDIAPPFTLPDQSGHPVSLDDYSGQAVLLYFYPQDETPGCTTQACRVRDHWQDFRDRGVVVLGVSPDPVESHRAFTDHHDLPHTLLSDPEHKVMEVYEAWGEKNMYGRISVGPIRSSVLVGPDGRIVKRWKRVQAAKHAEQALKAIDNLL